MSIHDLARACKTGSNVMWDIESGILEAHDSIIFEIASALDLTHDEVLEAIPHPRSG